MIKWLDGFLRDPTAMRKARLGVVGGVIIILPLLYFGFWEQISIGALLSGGVGVLGVLSLMSVWTAKIEVGNIVYDVSIDTNIPLKDVLKDNKEKMLKIQDVDLAIETVTAFNKREQDTADKKLTAEAIQDLEWKIRDLKIKGKSTLDLDTRIEFLRENPLFDKTHTPFDIRDLLSSDLLSSNKKKKKNKKRGKYNPKTDGKGVDFFKSLFQFAGIGANAGMAFILDDIKVILTYYGMLILAIAFASLREAKNIKENTDSKFFDDQRDKNKILTLIVKTEGTTNGKVQLGDKRVIA